LKDETQSIENVTKQLTDSEAIVAIESKTTTSSLRFLGFARELSKRRREEASRSGELLKKQRNSRRPNRHMTTQEYAVGLSKQNKNKTHKTNNNQNTK